MEQRIWSKPQQELTYVIGGDVAEGLERGDDSVLEGICVETGEQVFEVQGKIDPITFGEIAYQYGTWYNNALIGIENNADGGSNRILSRLGYPNIYLQANNSGEAYDKQTSKLGFNTNLRTRAEIIASGRAMMQDGSVIVRSQLLLAQFEIFALNKAGTRFEALPGGHDDLVMAWLIAIEMFRRTLEIGAMEGRIMLPYIDGKPFDPELEDVEEHSIVDKLVDQAKTKQEKERIPIYPSTVGNLV